MKLSDKEWEEYNKLQAKSDKLLIKCKALKELLAKKGEIIKEYRHKCEDYAALLIEQQKLIFLLKEVLEDLQYKSQELIDYEFKQYFDEEINEKIEKLLESEE